MELGGNPSSFRWAGVNGISERSSFGRKRGRSARLMLNKGMTVSARYIQPPYSFISVLSLRGDWVSVHLPTKQMGYARTHSWAGQCGRTAVRTRNSTASAETLYTICFTSFSENIVLLCRRVISARRGCRQFPGLSLTGVAAAVCFTGVNVARDDTGTSVADDITMVVRICDSTAWL
jgi:hypothetical protein